MRIIELNKLLIIGLIIVFITGCGNSDKSKNHAFITDEDSAIKYALENSELFLQTLKKAIEVNQRFVMRYNALADSVNVSKELDMGLLLQNTEIDYIWEAAVKDENVLQGQIVMGERDGVGVTLKLYPDVLIGMEGVAFNTRFESIEISGGYGTATVQEKKIKAIDIENFDADIPNNKTVVVRLFIKQK